jgi:hypothetical protein
MNTRPSLYRSTLVAAAVAIGCFGAAAAHAHDHGWRGHDEDRGWHGHDRGWRDRDEDRGFREHERGWRRAYGSRYGYSEPAGREGWAEYAPPAVYYPAPPPPAAYGPGGVSVVVRLPF